MVTNKDLDEYEKALDWLEEQECEQSIYILGLIHGMNAKQTDLEDHLVLMEDYLTIYEDRYRARDSLGESKPS